MAGDWIKMRTGLLLQFGHDFSAVETRETASSMNSTSSLQFGHDFSAVETGTYQVGGTALNSVLQFGHDFSAVET